MQISFHKPYLSRTSTEYIYKAITESQICGNKKYSRLVQEWLEKNLDIKYALFTTSCTHAIELASLSLRLKEGDEVIMPSFTFVSTANAFVRNRVKPVFVDINEEDLNIDINEVEKKINKKTKAIVPVHYAGNACDMDKIMDLAKIHNLNVIEDAAQGFDAVYKNKYQGTIGNIGCLSFHETKNITCGEGGAFLTNDEEIYKKAEIIREKGTNRMQFLRGEVNKYTWVDIGSSYIQSDILAALLLSQFEIKDEIRAKRQKLFQKYLIGLKRLNELGIITLPVLRPYNKSNYHIFYILLKNEDQRNSCRNRLVEKGISASFHYVPLHSSPYGRELLGNSYENLPITEKISQRLLRLPIYPDLTDDEQNYIIETLYTILM